MALTLPGSPLVLVPNFAALPYNFSHESAWSGNNWLAETGTPARDSDHAFIGTYSAKLTGSANQGILNRFNYDTAIWGTLDSGPYFAGTWIYPTAYTGSAYVRLGFELETTGDNSYTSLTADTFLSALTLNTWNFIYLSSGVLSAAQQTNFERVDLRVALIANGGSGTFWSDCCYFGRAINWRGLTPNPSGAVVTHPYKIRKKVFSDFDRNEYGAFSARRYNTGFYKGEIDCAPMDSDSQKNWSNVIDHLADDTRATIFYNRHDPVYNYYAKAALDQDDDGLSQIPGTPNWHGKMKWCEVIA